jgi:hypothetical protein
MRRITSGDLQVFAAGAIALDGFHALIQLPRHLAFSNGFPEILSSIIATLGLPLAIGILVGSQVAFRLTQILLCVMVVLGCITLAATAVVLRVAIFHNVFWLQFSRALLVSAILLGLAFWSISKRRAEQRTPNHATQPTAGPSDA